jgi:hypothetical protein
MSPTILFEFFLCEKALIAPIAMEAVNELFKRRLAEIFWFYVVYPQIGKVFESCLFTRSGNPSLIDKNQLRMDCGCFTANGTGFGATFHGRRLSHCSGRVDALSLEGQRDSILRSAHAARWPTA